MELRTWMTAVFCCILNFLLVGLFKIAGLLFVETKAHFQISRQSASLPFILSIISRSFSAPISGFVGHAYGLRIVLVAGCVISSLGIFTCFFATSIWFIYILYGGVVGFGVGLTNSLLPQVININFKKDFSKANGISSAGVALAVILLSPIVEYFLRTYGLSGTFLILSAFVLHGVPAAMMVKLPQSNFVVKRKSNKPNGEIPIEEKYNNFILLSSAESKNQTELPNKAAELKPVTPQRASFRCPKSLQVFTNISYILIAFSHGSTIFLAFAYMTICTDYALDKGMTIIESTYILMITGVTDIIARVSFGWVTDGGYMTRANFCALLFFVSTVAMIWTVWTVSLVTMTIAVCLQSLCIGALFPIVPGIIPKYVEKDQQTIAIASAPIFLVPLSATTPLLIGYFKDDLGSYDALMYFFSLISISNCIFLTLLPRIDRWRRNRKQEEEIEN